MSPADHIPMDEEPSKSETALFGDVVRGGFFLYIDQILVNAIGFIFWLTIAWLGSADIVGSTSSAISLAIILRTLMSFEMFTGIKRFLGQCIGRNDLVELKDYQDSSQRFTVLLYLLATLVVILANPWIGELTGLGSMLIILVAFEVLAEGIGLIPKSLIITTFKTKWLLYVDALSNSIRLLLAVLLLFSGFGVVGATLCFVVAGLINSIALILLSNRLLRGIPSTPKFLSWKKVKDVLEAGFYNWLPNTIIIIGTQLGILISYRFTGGAETGIYFIAYALASIILSIPMTFFGLLFPVLSGLAEGQDTTTWKGLRLTIALATPFTVILAIYAPFILALINPGFASGQVILSILAFSVLFSCYGKSIEVIVYAQGKYRQVLLIGIAQSVTQVILYLMLVPPFGSVGTAISFTAGVIAGALTAWLIAYRSKYYSNWQTLWPYLTILGAVGIVLWQFNVSGWIGIPLILGIFMIILGRTKILTYNDLREIVPQILSEPFINRVYPHLHPLLKLLFPE